MMCPCGSSVIGTVRTTTNSSTKPEQPVPRGCDFVEPVLRARDRLGRVMLVRVMHQRQAPERGFYLRVRCVGAQPEVGVRVAHRRIGGGRSQGAAGCVTCSCPVCGNAKRHFMFLRASRINGKYRLSVCGKIRILLFVLPAVDICVAAKLAEPNGGSSAFLRALPPHVTLSIHTDENDGRHLPAGSLRQDLRGWREAQREARLPTQSGQGFLRARASRRGPRGTSLPIFPHAAFPRACSARELLPSSPRLRGTRLCGGTRA
jgi:hypothetical protein